MNLCPKGLKFLWETLINEISYSSILVMGRQKYKVRVMLVLNLNSSSGLRYPCAGRTGRKHIIRKPKAGIGSVKEWENEMRTGRDEGGELFKKGDEKVSKNKSLIE